MSKYVDKVRCFDCEEIILRKNLKQHYLRYHENKPIKFKSSKCTDISAFFGGKRAKYDFDGTEQVDESEASIVSNAVKSPAKSSTDVASTSVVSTGCSTELLQELIKKVKGIICNSGEERTITLSNSICFTMISLEPTKNVPNDKQVSLFMDFEGQKHLICTLEYGKLMQQLVKLKFMKEDSLKFSVNGEGIIHVLGYHLNEEDENDKFDTSDPQNTSEINNEDEEEDEFSIDRLLDSDPEDTEESDDEWKPEIRHFDELFKRSMVHDVDSPLQKLNPKSKKTKKVNFADDSLVVVPPDDSYLLPQVDIDELEAEDEELDNELSEGEEEDLRELEDEDNENEEDSKSESDDNEEMKESLSSKKRKSILINSQSKKQRIEKDDMNSSIGRTPMPKQKKLSMVYVKCPSESPSPVVTAPNAKSSSKKLTSKSKLESGVQSEDLRIGNGPIAKNGKLVHVHYTGQFTNGKTFEKCLPPMKAFSFKLGRAEVIKGWDIGVEGMKVGGKRKITIPPNMAYGKRGSDNIPPNSTLVFTLELKAVK